MLTYRCIFFSQLTLDELYALMALRQEVFVVEQDCPYQDADGKDPGSWHLLGTDLQGRLLSCARLLPSGLSYPGYASIGRVVTSPIIRREGEGKVLMQEALSWCSRLFPGSDIKISAQCYLEAFYTNFGFKAIGEPYLEDDIPHIAMIQKSKS